MRIVSRMKSEERTELFLQTAADKGVNPVVIEKDFWVCYVLFEISSSKFLQDKLLFKGGTSLSKAYGLIERFSEDIDLILDWKQILDNDPNDSRSKNRQDRYNKNMDLLSRSYIEQEILPELKRVLDGVCTCEIDSLEPDTIQVNYPKAFEDSYIRPEVKVEIGVKASWVPNKTIRISPYAAEEYPDVFHIASFPVGTVTAERTFWEKATILHQEAHRPDDKPQSKGYSRHYYDLYRMYKSPVKDSALKDIDLLLDVVQFKMKFYPSAWSRYELAIPPTFRLIPNDLLEKQLLKDYRDMKEMFFGEVPDFSEILEELGSLEKEINSMEVDS